MSGTFSENKRIATQIADSYKQIQKSEDSPEIKLIKANITDMIEKGEISDQLGKGYGPASEAIKFTKKGKEIKEQIPGMLTTLNAQKVELVAKMAVLAEQIGMEPSVAYEKYQELTLCSYPYEVCSPKYDSNQGRYEDETDQHKNCSKYNSLCYMVRSVIEDITTLEVLNKNLEDGKSYTLSVSQLISLGFN